LRSPIDNRRGGPAADHRNAGLRRRAQASGKRTALCLPSREVAG